MVSIDGTEISGATIDGTDVQEITIDGNVAWTATTIIDDFEDGDMSEYNHTETGGTSNVSSNRSWSGSNSLYMEGASYNAENYGSSSGLNYYPTHGDNFKAYVYSNSGDGRCRPRLGFFLQSDSVPNTGNGANGYAVLIDHDAGDFRLVDGDGVIVNDSINVGNYENEWLEYNVQTDGDTITAELFDSNGNNISTISVSDNRWTSGGIGWRLDYGGSSDWCYFDYCVKP